MCLDRSHPTKDDCLHQLHYLLNVCPIKTPDGTILTVNRQSWGHCEVPLEMGVGAVDLITNKDHSGVNNHSSLDIDISSKKEPLLSFSLKF